MAASSGKCGGSEWRRSSPGRYGWKPRGASSLELLPLLPAGAAAEELFSKWCVDNL